MHFFLITLAAAVGLIVPTNSAAAAGPQESVRTTWRLLDYVAVDYSGAVSDGRVVSAPEFAEMQEFTATVEKQLGALPPTPGKASLLRESVDLRAAIDTKAPASEVSGRARKLGADLLKSYPVPIAPPRVPDLARGDALYRTTCAACHGETGAGNGPMARSLNPPPVDFTDRTRANQRSAFALEQVIDQGLDGTAMPSFRNLPAEDRWALAFKVGTFAYSDALAAEGKRIWDRDLALRSKIPNLAALASLTPNALANDIGEQRAVAVMAYLRANPSAIVPDQGGSLALTRARLAASVAAYRSGDRDEAKRLALSAYLDGFEPLEPTLSSRDAGLMHRIEGGMGKLRSDIAAGRKVTDVETDARALEELFAQADQALSPQAANSASTFVSAVTILVREGVEALLIVIAMIAFLAKAKREDMLPYVHGGWISALALGVLTWFVATSLISVSGASRELTEGFGGIFAACVLVFVGIWMHGKANAEAWQRYVREKMDRALSAGSGWFLFGLAFLVVYREVFETILFYAAMWKDSPAALISGVVVGTAILAAVAWVMLRYSAKLPITQFFRFSAVLMAVLAVILAGKGVAAIQEAGLVAITPLPGFPRVDGLGIHPSLQVLLAQMSAVVALGVGFLIAGNRDAVIAGRRHRQSR